MDKKTAIKKRLGRTYIPDEKDKEHSIKDLLKDKSTDRHFKYYWSNGWWGDQGDKPESISYSWLHWLEDGSITQSKIDPPIIDPTVFYERCKKVDKWRGSDYDDTSVRSGAKVLVEEGYIRAYNWTKDVETMALAILTTAPVLVGTTWYSEMSFPDDKGIIKPRGSRLGGHAYVVNGVNTEKRMFRIKNSWGRNWGNKGFAYISFDDMQKLIDEYGDVCLAEEIKK
jgi:hypothetical protein